MSIIELYYCNGEVETLENVTNYSIVHNKQDDDEQDVVSYYNKNHYFCCEEKDGTLSAVFVPINNVNSITIKKHKRG